jgi:hypothetical protein
MLNPSSNSFAGVLQGCVQEIDFYIEKFHLVSLRESLGQILSAPNTDLSLPVRLAEGTVSPRPEHPQEHGSQGASPQGCQTVDLSEVARR